jgi:hypothetical protein
MSRSLRPLVRPPLIVQAQMLVAAAQAAHAEAGGDVARLSAEHARELAALRRELDELHDIVSDVVAVLCDQADEKLAALRKQLEIALIKLTPRDGKPLN